MLGFKLNHVSKRGYRQTIFGQIILILFWKYFCDSGLSLTALPRGRCDFHGSINHDNHRWEKTLMALNAYVNSRHKIRRICEKAGFPSSHRVALIWWALVGSFRAAKNWPNNRRWMEYNSLWLSDVIWWLISGSILAHVMDLNQCWLLIRLSSMAFICLQFHDEYLRY